MDIPYSVHSPADRHLDCFHSLALKNNAVTNICIQVCVDVFSFVLDMYLGMEYGIAG